MPWPADHPVFTDPALAPWRAGLEALCPDAEVLRVLRHLPGRRVTSQIRTQGGDAVAKVFATPRARGNDRRLRYWKASKVADLVPAPLGADATGHVGLIEFIPGEPLDHLDGDQFVAALEAAGDALRHLHQSRIELDRSWTIDEELDQLGRRATDRATRAVNALCALDWTAEAVLVSAHRDCHPAQAVIAADGLRWIDLDDAAMAPPGLDVGNLIAHLRRDAVVGKRTLQVAERAIAAFSSGYGVLPDATEQWQWLSLARLACLAENRHHRPDWADALLVLLAQVSGGVSEREAPRSPYLGDRSDTGVEPDVVAALGDVGLSATSAAVLVATGHQDRPVYCVETNRGPVAVKYVPAVRAGSPLRDLVALWQSSFGASRRPAGLPEPLGWSPGQRAIVMEWLPGVPLAHRGDPPPSPDHLASAARLIADLHECGIRHRRARDAEAVLRSAQRKSDELQPTEVGALAAELVAALARRLPDDQELVPSHGDFSPRNVIVTDDGARLIDFDNLQLADPARDVTYYGAWLWVTGLLHDGRADWTHADLLITQYCEFRPHTHLDAQVAFHRAAALLRIVHGWTVLRREPSHARPVLEEALRIVTA